MMKEVTKDMLIGDILREDATIAPILMASVCTVLAVRHLKVRVWKRQLWFTGLIAMNWLQRLMSFCQQRRFRTMKKKSCGQKFPTALFYFIENFDYAECWLFTTLFI